MRMAYWLLALAVVALAGCASTARPPAAQVAGAREITTPSGLKYQDLVVGNGALAEPGMQVLVNYTGWLTDSTKFDSSLDPGRKPLAFTIGAGMVIRGWDEGVTGMRIGGRRRLVIPPELAYQERGYPPVIPPNATLVFEVQFVGVQAR